tara:strand:+ start:9633 stop:9851 length:219 start_codon:yes stop_codon:yes gene_type:complete
MKPYMVRFCDWSYRKLQQVGEPRTARQLYEAINEEAPKKARNISNSVACNYALRGDSRFRSLGGKPEQWTLA